MPDLLQSCSKSLTCSAKFRSIDGRTHQRENLLKITAVEALILHSDRSYTQGHGLIDAVEPLPRRVLTDRYAGGRHLCTYPDGEQTVLVRIETDAGLIGWGEAHAPYAPTVTQTLILDLLAPLVLGENPLASEVLWERMYGAMRLRGHNTGFTMEAIAGSTSPCGICAARFWTSRSIHCWVVPTARRCRPMPPACRVSTDAQRQEAVRCLSGRRLHRGQAGHRSAQLWKKTWPPWLPSHEVTGERAHLLVDAHGAYDLGTAVQVGT